MVKRIKIIAFLIGLFLLSPEVYAQRIPSGKDYKMMKSGHFTIVYYSNKRQAEKILTVSENIHTIIAKKFNVGEIHTTIVLVDVTDLANGMASILPDNVIILYDVPPELYSQTSLLHYYYWIEELVIHEYAHILHLNQVEDIYKAFRSMGFSYMAPNLLLPLSSLEGIAVNMESAYTPMGRAKSSFKDMILRTAVHEKKTPAIDEISTFINRIPSGYGPYIWGGAFHYYLSQKISEQKLLKAYHRNAGLISATSGCLSSGLSTGSCSAGTCFPLNSLIKNYSGTDYYTHYDEWMGEMQREYTAQITNMHQVTQPVVLNEDDPFWNIYSLAGHKEKIWFSGYSPDTGYGLYRLDPGSGRQKAVIEDMLITGIAVQEDFLYFTGLKIYDNIRSYFTLYRYDLKTEAYEPYLDLERVLDVAVRGRHMLILRIKDHKKVLTLVNMDNRSEKIVLEMNKYEQVSDLTFSGDDEFYFTGKKERDFFDIYRYNMRSKKLVRLTYNPSIELSLSYDEKEKKLFFISDYNLKFDYYAYVPEEEKFFQLSEFISGSLKFIRYKGGFYGSYYQSDGFRMIRLNEEGLKKTEVPYNMKTVFPEFEKEGYRLVDTPVAYSKEEDFSTAGNLFSNVIPIPVILSSGYYFNPGLILLFSDIFQRNILSLQADYNMHLEEWSFLLDYFLFRDKTDLSFHASSVFSGETDDIIRRRIIEGQVTFFKNTFINYFSLHSGLSYYHKRELRIDTDTSYNSFFSGIRFNSVIGYAYSVVPEKGWDLGLTYRMLREWFGSSWDVDLLNLGIKKYCRTFFLHHILKLDLSGGAMLNPSSEEPYRVAGIDLFRQKAIYEVPLNAYSYYEKDGKNFIAGNISYNFPLIWIERGIKNMPLFLSHIWMKLYYEAGDSFNSVKQLTLLDLLGAEMHFNFKIFCRVLADNTVGFSYELGKRKERYIYFRFNIRY
ncbi:MAG: hypothetical protein KKH98_00555 [Spirochaetes bacterium]|nr:hypothetical protein [Spirochaetota bacterium]